MPSNELEDLLNQLGDDVSLDDPESVATPLQVVASPETVSVAPPPSEDETLLAIFNQAPGAGDLPVVDDGDDLVTAIASMGIRQQKTVPEVMKAWMIHHDFFLVNSVAQLNRIVDDALEAGICSLDVETQGLDTRIYKNKATGKWETVHKIVGYCISVDGVAGYYVPVRHTAEESVNLPIGPTEEAITRLCRAAQPTVTAEGFADNPLSSTKIETPGKVVIHFWNAKFDQEMLYPVTGIDFWHPESFEDGMLLMFSYYSNDKRLNLKDKSKENITTKIPIELPEDPAELQKVLERKCIDQERGLYRVVFSGTTPSGKQRNTAYEMVELKNLFERGREIKFAELHPLEGLIYGCSDAICTRLFADQPKIKSIAKDQKYAFTYRLEKQVAQVTRVLERYRVKLDKPYVHSLYEMATIEASQYEDSIIKIAEAKGFSKFDPRSSQQLAELLFSERGLNINPKPPKNEKSGKYKTDADTLETLAEEIPNAPEILLKIVKYRQIDKVKNTYLDNMIANVDSNDEARLNFKQTGAPTGRYAAPAGQPDQGFGGFPPHGIPATYDKKKPAVAIGLRKAFIARPGYTMVKSDYAGEELRIVTNLSREPVWIKEFKHGTGDLHSITARAFFGKEEVSKQERQMGKTANFALVYGGGPQAIMRATGCSAQEGARRKANFDKAVPVFSQWVKRQKALVRAQKGVFTAFKRWMSIPDIDNEDRAIQAACERYATNWPIQGSGADIMKIAMVLLYREFYKRGWAWDQADIVRMILTVHDEIVFEVKHEYLEEVMPVIKEQMEAPYKMAGWDIPLIAEPLIDLTWDAKYDWDLIKHGKVRPAKPDEKLDALEIRVGDKVYHRVPEWLEGLVFPDWMKEGETPSTPTTPATPPTTPPVQPVPDSAAPQQGAAKLVQSPIVAQPAAAPLSPVPQGVETEVFNLSQVILTRRMVNQVAEAVYGSMDLENGVVVELRDSFGNLLIDPSKLRLRVNPDHFKYKLKDRNLLSNV